MKICCADTIYFFQRKLSIAIFTVTTVICWVAHIEISYAATTCKLEVARIVSIQGIIELRRAQQTIWQSVSLNTTLCAGDMIRARSQSRAALRLNNESMLRLDQKTSITFPELQEEKSTSLLDLFEGAIHIITRTPRPFKVRTPFVNASVEGTEFFVGLNGDTAKVVVYEGRVSASNDLGNIVLNDHEAAVTVKDQAPRKEIIIRPTDAVQWALYYPAISDYWLRDTNQKEAELSVLIQQAGHSLTVGQVDESKSKIKQVLELEPDNSDAYALLAIIAVVQNNKDQALVFANKAVTQNPDSAAAYLALSYTQQAHFEIEAALDSVKKVIALDAKNVLAWARLAELQMSLGDLDHALDAALYAVNLDPGLSKTQTLLGFAHLLQIDIQTAKDNFYQAIALDQADPMPRLGLGLALIREGNLEDGRIELEIAASLDPGNSLIRSYLGKAYFEEKRYSLSSTQFELAKERDPKDPTPWFYDAIQKQTQNRPIEALQDIQKSIELNDNRAVYRSKFLLDRDEAARGSSLARIFETLGFEKRAVMETAKSLSFDPANHSAHRFLSDTYTNIPRHEAARVSELLQAQLLQPINVNPVQPHMAVADLNIITGTGPSTAGFNEFTSIMERSKPQLVASGIVGSNGSLGNEMVLSKFNERTSISLGQFHYESNGFRTNNDQNHDILNAFVQHAVTTKLNVQAEVRTRSTNQGNLLLNFDRDNINSRAEQNRIRQKIHDESVRIGAKYDLLPNQHIIVSGQFNDRKLEEINNPFPFTSPLVNSKIESYQTEIQYQFRNHWLNVITGSGVFRTSFDQTTQQISAINNRTTSCCTHEDGNRDKTNGYIYANLNFIPTMNTTAGFSYDSYDETGLTSIDGFNPKFGFQWNIISNLRLRMAWFESIKSPLATNQTIEPTQIAGFNQLFDDINGTKSRRMGIGFDAHYENKIFTGVEVSKRDLSSPRFLSANSVFLDHKENLYYGYLYGVLHKNWVAKSEIRFEKFSRPQSELQQIDTLSAPIGIDYFNPNGFFANLTGTFVRQKVERLGREKEGTEKYFLVDASIGYRLPNRKGILSLEARNLFDEYFLFQHINFSTSQAVDSRFVPTRTIVARITFNF
jgi:tetratricopeptide (TPR) repeat protein